MDDAEDAGQQAGGDNKKNENEKLLHDTRAMTPKIALAALRRACHVA